MHERRAGTAALLVSDVAARSPDWPYPFRRLGVLARAAGETAEAVKWLRAATKIAPHDVFSWVELGHALKETGDTRGAIESLERIPLSARSVAVHLRLGRMHLLLDHSAEHARASFARAWRASSGFALEAAQKQALKAQKGGGLSGMAVRGAPAS